MEIPVNKTVVPELAFDSPLEWEIPIGYDGLLVQKQAASSSSISGTMTWILNPGNKNIGVSRRLELELPLSLAISGTTGAINFTSSSPLESSEFGFRSDFLNAICSYIQISFGTGTNSEIRPYMRRHVKQMGPPEYYDDIPNYQPDQFQRISDGIGSVRNPLRGYEDCQPGIVSRGMSLSNWSASGNTGGTCTLTGTLKMALDYAPFTDDEAPRRALLNINEVNFTFQMDKWSRGFQYAYGNLTVVPTLTGSANLHAWFYNVPQEVLASAPPKQLFPYQNINQIFVQTPDQTLAASASSTFTANNVVVSAIPDYILIFVAENFNNITSQSTDTYALITNCQLTFGNNSLLLSQMNQLDLFRLSKKNGLPWDYQSAVSYRGLPLIVSAADLQLQGIGPGVGSISANLSAIVTATNISSSSRTLDLYIVPVYNGFFEIDEDGNQRYVIGPLAPSQVQSLPVDTSHIYPQQLMAGGSFWDDLVKGFTQAFNWVARNKIISNGAKVLGAVLPGEYGQTASEVGNIASQIGLGGVPPQKGGALSGGAQSGGSEVTKQMFRRM